MTVEPLPPIRTEIYEGSTEKATRAFAIHAQQMAAAGYYPIGQVYTPGSWNCLTFLVALVLCLFLIGILIFIYLIIVKPDGALVVTYQYRGP